MSEKPLRTLRTLRTLSFCMMDDLDVRISREWKFSNESEIRPILEKLWNKFLSGKCSDISGYFFDNASKNDDIEYVYQSLTKKKYYVRNRFEKYYVVAFALDYTKFYVWSKDCDPKIINWNHDGELVNNYDSEHDVNPVIKLMKQLNSH
ncbi:hypothetical protein QLL95_gp0475 [Cotonvirus japonicus]|uniref:Uncharacterized protein n=1 Tax=Cotonvirus japonicus TaxID=2811091 RepID=A0ABM7NTZ1_9VIRU|nr:hypothetical protein QLL95_gp0475 [Cotonvirus japonicus]BCS83648.1 hypothetical protein [Cotonvirus japonicus]